MRRTKLYTDQPDKQIKDAVLHAFVYDPRLSSFNVDAEVSAGTVTLSGVVDNLKAKKSAEQDAQNVTGVHRVVNNIKVRPEVLPPDEDLEADISSVLVTDQHIERFDINIDVYSGTAYLSGSVNTSWEKQRAGRLAEGVKGILRVVNNIEYEYKWTWKPDWQIEDDVEDQL